MRGKMRGKNKNKNKKKKLIFMSLFIIIIISFFFIYKHLNKEIVYSTIKYDILNEDVLSEGPMKDWLSTEVLNKGFAIKENDNYTYVIISYGKTLNPKIGICLNNIIFSKTIDIEYSFIEEVNDNPGVTNYYPKMILRFEGTGLKISNSFKIN